MGEGRERERPTPRTGAPSRDPSQRQTPKGLRHLLSGPSKVLFNGFTQFFIEALNLVKTMARSLQGKKR